MHLILSTENRTITCGMPRVEADIIYCK